MMRTSIALPRAWPLAAAALLLVAWLALGGLDTIAWAVRAIAPDAASTAPAATVAAVADAAHASSNAAEANHAAAMADPAATPAPALHIRVSLEDRMLWLVEGADTLLRAPVAIGKAEPFVYEGRRFDFETPRGERAVVAKATDPLWTPPDWHYYEKAAKRGLEVVPLEEGSVHELADGSVIEVRDDQVGRVNRFGYFTPFTPGVEIMFDGKLFIPPLRTAQRSVPNALGPYKLDMGDGYLIHGTHMYTEMTIGEAASHGCVRMRNADLAELYARVRPGTPVIIY